MVKPSHLLASLSFSWRWFCIWSVSGLSTRASTVRLGCIVTLNFLSACHQKRRHFEENLLIPNRHSPHAPEIGSAVGGTTRPDGLFPTQRFDVIVVKKIVEPFAVRSVELRSLVVRIACGDLIKFTVARTNTGGRHRPKADSPPNVSNHIVAARLFSNENRSRRCFHD